MIEKLIGIFKSQKTANTSQTSTTGNNTSQQQSGLGNKQTNITIMAAPQPTWAEKNKAAEEILLAYKSYIYILQWLNQSTIKSILREQSFKAQRKLKKSVEELSFKLQENDQKIIKNKINSMSNISETNIDSEILQTKKDMEDLKSILAVYLDS